MTGKVSVRGLPVDVAGFVYALLVSLLDEDTRVYAHGPLPNWGDSMVVFDIFRVRPVTSSVSRCGGAQDFVLQVQVYSRERQWAYRTANSLCAGIEEVFWKKQSFGTDSGLVGVSALEFLYMPMETNSNLVNETRAHRFDFEVNMVVRRL